VNEPASVYLSLVVPVYNEEKRLPLTMEKTLAYLDQRCKKETLFTFEIIIVDDGSTDRTYEVALDFVKRRFTHMIRVMRLEKNRGKGGAVTQVGCVSE
jgi:dolichyl-phosphate beta-glucosyltransferase